MKELYTILAVLFGSASTLIGMIISNRLQLKNQLIHMKKEREEEYIKYKRSMLEEAHMILSKILFENSLTMSYIIDVTSSSAKEYHERYIENHKKLERLSMIINLYFPDLYDDFKGIFGLSNVFWGNQMMLLKNPMDDKTLIHLKKNINIQATEIGEKIFRIKHKIIDFSNSINRLYLQDGKL